jgi:site-specific DNA-methyltransferase (adenine-specific)
MEIQVGDCRALMPRLEASSVDAIVTDPPYGLAFMGKEWDHGVPGVPFWVEALRVLKPGGHLVAFGGTRTYHRLACAIEDAGLEVRDCLMWLYGSGFPKSLDVSKAIDKAAGAERKRTKPASAAAAYHANAGNLRPWMSDPDHTVAGPEAVTEAASRWQGWGTALKPAWEPIVLARRPVEGTVAANVLEHGPGALNVDGCRIGTEARTNQPMGAPEKAYGGYATTDEAKAKDVIGRWPANLVLDAEAASSLDARSDGASRFFYTSKASSGERHYAGKNAHPTVKPVDLMRWLCRLVTPPGGLVLDPFMGSGSTGVAALAEGFRFLGLELDPEYAAIARRRIAGPLFAED